MAYGIYPFGNSIALITDFYHQYIHFYSYFIDAVKGNESLLYSWNSGLGSNHIGNVAYYSASPLLLILFLFPKNLFAEAALVLVLVKIGLCGVSACYFIRKKFTTLKTYEAVLFSSFYALMSYNIIYYYNLMWLDGVILLPLLILSLDSILHNKSVIPYTILLTLLFISNFYISYMVGLFIFLYFIISLFINKKKIKDYKGIIVFFKFAKGTLLSIGISAFLTVPTFFQLLGSLGSAGSFSSEIKGDFLLKLFSGMYDSVKDGSPNIFIGTFVFILVPIFFLSKIDHLEKIKWGTLLAIMAASFVLPTLNVLWHVGDNPNWFPYRYSFIFSFILFYISLAAYEKVGTIRFRTVITVSSIIVIAVVGVTFTVEGVFIIIATIPLLILFSVVLLVKKRKYNKFAYIPLILFATTELLFNSFFVYFKVNDEVGTPSRKQYTIYQDYKVAINEIKKQDPSLFYRIETDADKTNNDSLTLGHSSFGHFSSMLNNDLLSTMESLGFFARKAKYNNNGSTILTESLLGLKYFVSSKKLEDEGYELVSSINDLYIYQNTNFLPIGYPIKEDMNIERYSNPFQLQNKIYQTLFATNNQLFSLKFPQKIKVENANQNGNSFTRIDKDKDISIKYYFDNNMDSNLHMMLDIQNWINTDSIEVLINNKDFGDFYKGIIKIGESQTNPVMIELRFNRDKVKFLRDELFYAINTKEVSSDLENIDKDAFEITEFKENQLKAKVHMKEDQLLFLSIPWDKGWRVTVDDKRVQPSKVLGAFMGIPMEKGEHDIKLTFIPKGFVVGSTISMVSLLFFAIVVWRERLKKEGRVTHDEDIST